MLFAELGIPVFCTGQSLRYGWSGYATRDIPVLSGPYNNLTTKGEPYPTDLSPPVSLQRPLITTERLLAEGETNPSARSFSALQLPVIRPYERQAIDIISDIKDGLRYALQTNNEWTLALHGTGTTGYVTVLDDLIEPDDKVLVGVFGHWGNMAANVSERFGAHVVRLEKQLGSRLSLQEIETALLIHRPNIFYIVSGESSTGVYQPLDGVGDLCYKYGCLSVAEVIATVGQLPLNMDQNKIDVVILSSQKGLGGLVGLAPLSLSMRAVEKMKNRKTPTFSYQTDLVQEVKALAKIADERVENVWKRHEKTRKYFHKRASEIGLQFFVPRKQDRLVGITTFWLPEGKDAFKIESFVLNKYRLHISPGFGELLGKVIRVGLFGDNAEVKTASNVITALQDALSSPLTNSS